MFVVLLISSPSAQHSIFLLCVDLLSLALVSVLLQVLVWPPTCSAQEVDLIVAMTWISRLWAYLILQSLDGVLRVETLFGHDSAQKNTTFSSLEVPLFIYLFIYFFFFIFIFFLFLFLFFFFIFLNFKVVRLELVSLSMLLLAD